MASKSNWLVLILYAMQALDISLFVGRKLGGKLPTAKHSVTMPAIASKLLLLCFVLVLLAIMTL